MFNFANHLKTIRARKGLYCVWIQTHGGHNAPLMQIWIDPTMSLFEVGFKEQAGACCSSDPGAKEQETSVAQDELGPVRRLSPLALGFAILACLLVVAAPGARAQTGGKISGMVRDKTGAVIVGGDVVVKNTASGIVETTKTDVQGGYSFPVLAVGQYELEATADGFKPTRKTDIGIDINSSLVIDIVLQLAGQNQSVTVTLSEEPIQVETTDTQLGEVIESKQVTEVPLNGRSYTDLFSTQVGVSPITTSGAGNSTSGGGFGTVPVAGNDNTGQFSINGQRESSNGFLLNGASVQESIGQQAGIIPNLDSIAEFRILTSNTDAEYGNYSGGLIDVVTKSGGNNLHGSAFEFLRNTNFDSKGFFSPDRSVFQQNQYGGTIGGPVQRDKVFFFADYQGQTTVQGMETGIVTVPSVANRGGDFSADQNSQGFNPLGYCGTQVDPQTKKTLETPCTVNGTYLAGLLTKELGYTVQPGEPFYFSGPTASNPGSAPCTSADATTGCVFPNAQIKILPGQFGNLPASKMLQYIPAPNVGANEFSSGAEKQRIHDNKGSARIDLNTTKYGSFNLYYFLDRYDLDNPYPSGLGGATVPGPGGVFDALSNGLDQVIVLNHTKAIGSTMVNEAHFSFTRLNNNIGIPKGGVGVSLADQNISTGPQGIQQGFPQYAGVEMMYFNSFAVGTNPFFLAQVNNTFDAGDHFSKVMGAHSLKFGGSLIRYNVKQLPDLVANGTFSFFGSGNQSTGNGFADFLLGLPDFYSQQSSPAFYESSATGGVFAQDSWRVRPNLTINYGLRWDYITPWSEEHNQATTFVAGVQSTIFPGAPLGYLVPGDILPDGSRIPSGIAPTPLDNFSPRLGIAYSPGWSSGLGKKLTGGPGKTSIRLGAGRFFNSVEGLTVAYPTGNPPYGLTYTSPEAPIMATPFVGALTGTQFVQQFPVNVPPYNVSVTNPDSKVDWSRYTPINGAGSVYYKNKTPYTMSYNLTIERQLDSKTLISAGYIGSLSRHLLTVRDANPGNPGLCLSLSQPQEVAPGSRLCGPFQENNVFTRAAGTCAPVVPGVACVVDGTRGPFPNTIGTNAYYQNMGNANYNALQVTLKRSQGRLTWLASYTYGKSQDQTSSIQEQVYPYDFNRERGISAFDIKHDFVASYNYDLPIEKLLRTSNRWARGWALSGITRFASGLPVTFASNGDNALVYVQNNGVNSVSVDLPDYTPGNLAINHDPRNGKPYFNTSLFTPNALGTPGTSPRRFFYGPGISNFDLALHKVTQLTESKSIEFRVEAFNAFNHAQFYPSGSVDGNISSPTFGHVLKAASPRIGQLAMKLFF